MSASLFLLTALRRRHYNAHFIDHELVVQKNAVVCPGTHSKRGAKSGFRANSARLPLEDGYFISNPAAFLKQVFPTSGTENGENEGRGGEEEEMKEPLFIKG